MNIWYFPLESVKSRYTEQLCSNWIPTALEEQIQKCPGTILKVVEGKTDKTDITVGSVLDATGRGKFSLEQCRNFLTEIEKGNVKNGDVIYLQDYWTPGIEAIFYAMELYGIRNVRLYSMCHAQSVDEFDFTYPMRDWMRHYELGLDRKSAGIFVASSIHKEQLREAGFKAPIHVVSLPFGYEEVQKRMQCMPRNIEDAVVFSSRLDWEKNPTFMLAVAEKFLETHPNWNWYITTSGTKIRSNIPGLVDKIYGLSRKNPRFKVLENLTKDEYYRILCRAKIQFNSSKQDYVSWTLLEASTADCDLCYPDYRSFPECVPDDRRYEPENLMSALTLLDRIIHQPRTHRNIPELANLGRRIEGYIIVHGSEKEVNIWKGENIPEI